MSQLFIAQQLEELLQYWEDCNLCGEFNFQLNLVTKQVKTPQEQDLSALVGSELNMLGLFARALPDYQNLRKVLMGYPLTHKTNFLPRIPRDMRDVFNNDQALFFDHEFVKSPIQIPNFILKWNEVKRACVVDDAFPMPVVDLRQENWLNKLPYNAFFLKLSSPFVFTDSSNLEEWSVDSFLIYNDNDYVRIMSWPKEIERFLLTAVERKSVHSGIKDIKSKKVPKNESMIAASKVNDFFIANLAVLKNTSKVLTVQGFQKNIIHTDIYNDENLFEGAGQTLINLNLRLRIMLETINGFCKVMANLPPKKDVLVLDSKTSGYQNQIRHQWFELPMQVVEYFYTTTEQEKIIVKRGSGAEKSPHVRKAHTRRIVRSDGTIDNIWIEQSLIRADKLVNQQLQGGATKIQ